MSRRPDRREVVDLVATSTLQAERERYQKIGGRRPGTFDEHRARQVEVAKRRDRDRQEEK